MVRNRWRAIECLSWPQSGAPQRLSRSQPGCSNPLSEELRMALMDAKEYDPRPAQRPRRIIATIVLVVVAVGVYLYLTRYDSEKKVIDKFFEALEQKDFDKAYGLYKGDPDWKQHPQKYVGYTVNQFTLDWGPSGEYGPIT